MSKKTTPASMAEDLFDDPFTPQPEKYVKSHEPKTLTVLNAMEWLSRMARDTKLSDDFLTKAERVTRFLGKKMSITPRQAVLLSIYGEKTSTGDSFSMGELGNLLDCNNFEMIALRDDIRELERRRLIRRRSSYRGAYSYGITDTVYDAMTTNGEVLPVKRDGLDFKAFFGQVLEIMRIAIDDNEKGDRELTLGELHALMDANPQLPFVQAVQRGPFANDDDLLCFFYFANHLVNWDRDVVDIQHSNLDDVIGNGFRFARLTHALLFGDGGLVREEILEPVCEGGMAGTTFRLTPKAVKEYLSEYKPTPKKFSIDGMLMPDKIVEKPLFYNPDEEHEVARLASVLDEANYRGVCDRLEKAGMRRGICALLSGGPGTGKTETVLQLARRTGRPILQLNVSDILDKFVGESEKRAMAAFEAYRTAVHNSKVAPILFLNECDQLLNRRIKDCRNSVDQMSNALQNIFLQQLETLDGILICTTNLAQNLDTAFERRFLFKIEFSKPSREARIHIWKSMLPDLSDADAARLSDSYDFSGGQIENISRKALIDMALTGDSPRIEQYIAYCDHERVQAPRKTERKRIGF